MLVDAPAVPGARLVAKMWGAAVPVPVESGPGGPMLALEVTGAVTGAVAVDRPGCADDAGADVDRAVEEEEEEVASSPGKSWKERKQGKE